MVKNIYIISSYSTAKYVRKIVEVKFSSCGLRKKLRLRNCGVAVTEEHFFKSCGVAIAEVLPSSCGIAIADSKKSCACPPLEFTNVHPIGKGAKTFTVVCLCSVWYYVHTVCRKYGIFVGTARKLI